MWDSPSRPGCLLAVLRPIHTLTHAPPCHHCGRVPPPPSGRGQHETLLLWREQRGHSSPARSSSSQTFPCVQLRGSVQISLEGNEWLVIPLTLYSFTTRCLLERGHGLQAGRMHATLIPVVDRPGCRADNQETKKRSTKGRTSLRGCFLRRSSSLHGRRKVGLQVRLLQARALLRRGQANARWT